MFLDGIFVQKINQFDSLLIIEKHRKMHQ